MKQASKRLVEQHLIALVITSVFMLWQFVPLPLLTATLNRLDGIIYDFRLKHLPPWPDSVANIQIVDIDELSLQAYGRMPWPRAQFANLTEKLTELGAITIAFDILFTEPEMNPAQQVLAAMSDNSVKAQISAIAEQLDGDRQLATRFSQNEVILATLFHHQAQITKGILTPSSVTDQLVSQEHQLHRFAGYSANTEMLANQAGGQGFVNIVPDADGFIRRAPLVVVNQGKIYPSLALDAFRAYSLVDDMTLEWQPPQLAFLSAIRIGQSRIPTDNQGQLLIPFRARPFYYPYTSAADILAGKIRDQRFDNAMVFVGTSATGLADLRTTPVALNFPGVEIHATVFDALMSPQTLPYRPDWWQGAVFLQLLVIAVILTLVVPRLAALGGELFASAILLLVLASNFLLWRWQAIDIPLISSLLLILALSGYFISHGYLSENRRRKQVKAVFDRYVSPAHIDEMLEQPQLLNLTGQKKFLTVLFSDIRNFTQLSESLPPEQLSLWLNRVFSPLTEDIFSHQGTIDKYVGDMVMAFWGAPLADDQQASHALLTAFAMQASCTRLNREFQAQGLPEVHIGIGLNSGLMNVGDMGSEYRLSYTVLGDSVNLGSRLESLTKYYGVEILISEATRDAVLAESDSTWSVQDFLLVDKVNVKGKSLSVTIYLPLAPEVDNSIRQQCQLFEQILVQYFQSQFAEAKAGLAQLENAFPYPRLIELYQQRCDQLINEPPAKGWDGVFSHQQK